MNERRAKELRRLVDIGDRVLLEIENVEKTGDYAAVAKLREESKRIEEAIIVVKAEALKDNELAALRERAGDDENALDAYIVALKKAGRWSKLSRVASAEIERLERVKKKTPEQKARLQTLVRLHNEALGIAS